MTLYQKLKSEHRASLLEEKLKYPAAVNCIIKYLKENERYRDLTIEQAYDLRVFTDGSEDKMNMWANDLFDTNLIRNEKEKYIRNI